MGITFNKDGTAQGVAKARHHESLFPEDQRLYTDPYAGAFFAGSKVQEWMGTKTIDKLYDWMGAGGVQDHLTMRTKWLDDEITKVVKEENSKQLVILGAGYDTRGFRLEGLPDADFKTIEVDQPEVQQRKIDNLQLVIKRKDAKEIAEKFEKKQVEFVPIDFNQDSLDDKLVACPGFQSSCLTVMTLEGVTQYIPKESTADTLKKLKGIVAPGSTLLITYVPAVWIDIQDGKNIELKDEQKIIKTIVKSAKMVGEPWITGWTQEEFADFLKDCGYLVTSDTTSADYNDQYLKECSANGRSERTFDAVLNMERFVVAKAL